MAQIIALDHFKLERIAQTCFRPWRQLFNEPFDRRTRLDDLSDATLCRLAEPGEPATSLLYDLILCTLGCQRGVIFEELPKAVQLHVIDIHLFISDQIRFEMMRRLSWLTRLAADRYTILDMVIAFEETRLLCCEQPPILSADHPQHREYQTLVSRDQQVFIRRLLPSALEAFQKMILTPG